MRPIILTLAMLAAAPAAVAQIAPPTQTYSGTPPSNYQSPTDADAPCCGPPIRGASQSGSSRSGGRSAQNSEENCGTPDEFKACPPMPRHPLPYYPSNRHD